MRFEYFDMLSGEPIFVDRVGTIRSPKLREICPRGIGYSTYNLYLNFLSWDKERLLEYDRLMKYSGVDRLSNDKLNVFDVATLIKQTREFCRGVLSFFMLENLVWDESTRSFVALCDEDGSVPVGRINRDNFEDVRKMMLQLNYIGVDGDDAPLSYSDQKSKELWERTQGYLKELSKNGSGKDKPEYHLSNIVSKLCAAHPSYNLLNVYDLTIFQLYDAFFQTGYVRSADLNELIFSNHGGEKFKFEDWLHPILKNV